MSAKTDLAMLGRILLSFALIGFGGWGLALEGLAKVTPKVTDPHAILLGAGLLILPFFPGWFAAGASKVADALLSAWRGYKNPGGK